MATQKKGTSGSTPVPTEKAPAVRALPSSAVVRERWPWFIRDVIGRELWPLLGENLRLPGLLEDVAVEEVVRDGAWIVRAEAPGIDPANDADITVHDGLLTLKIERRQESSEESGSTKRSEFRYGSFERTVALPKGVDEAAIRASYTNGILEIKVPLPKKAAAPKGTKVPITS